MTPDIRSPKPSIHAWWVNCQNFWKWVGTDGEALGTVIIECPSSKSSEAIMARLATTSLVVTRSDDTHQSKDSFQNGPPGFRRQCPHRLSLGIQDPHRNFNALASARIYWVVSFREKRSCNDAQCIILYSVPDMGTNLMSQTCLSRA